MIPIGVYAAWPHYLAGISVSKQSCPMVSVGSVSFNTTQTCYIITANASLFPSEWAHIEKNSTVTIRKYLATDNSLADVSSLNELKKVLSSSYSDNAYVGLFASDEWVVVDNVRYYAIDNVWEFEDMQKIIDEQERIVVDSEAIAVTDDLLQIAETSVEPALYTQVSQKEYNKLKNSTVSEIAKKLWLNRKKDRSAIALSAGIKNYTRTKDQNMIIKTMLLKQFVIIKTEKQQQKEEITTYMKQYVDAMKPIEVTKKEFNELKNSTLFDIMKKAGMDWRKNRKDIAAALGVKNYKWTRSQNMTIRSAILKMFIIK